MKHDALRASNEYGEFENSQEGFEFRVGLTKRRLPVYDWCRDNHLVFKAFTEENAELAKVRSRSRASTSTPKNSLRSARVRRMM